MGQAAKTKEPRDGAQSPPGSADDLSPGSIVEALLFSSDAPLSAGKLAQILGIGTAADVKQHVEQLNQEYESTGRAYRIQPIAGGFQIFTLPVYDTWIGKLRKVRAETRLSQAALETLAVIAYKQPVLRANIEAIRGVAAGDILLRLREMKLIKIVGRAEEIGRPLLYGTTGRFLEAFGLANLKDLPKIEEGISGGVPKLKVVPPSEDSTEGTQDDAES